ncbi:MAG: HmuY family protein [Bacteroidetes bacterium]|nr:HmuY family protein [Bacteroidota bacterium]
MMKASAPIGAMMVVCALCGCMREEVAVPRQARGGVVEGIAHIGSDYGAQIWYDLASNSVVSSNSKMDWDLAFECGTNGWQVRLNGARLMRAHRTPDQINQATDTTGYGNTWKIDLPNGRPDSLAFGDWRTEHPVFVVDMGFNTMGLPMGLHKVQVNAVNGNEFQFSLAALNGSGVQEYTVQKDPARAYVHFSFASGSVVAIAPPLGTYDLVFTQYTEQFYAPDPYLAYSVTGVLDGYSGIRVAKINGNFNTVSLSDTLAHPFSTDQDAIGYNWKDYSFDTGEYIVYSNMVYIIQDHLGYFRKLHFIDYYDAQGQRGSPTFEMAPL